jgi:hypothetical protein
VTQLQRLLESSESSGLERWLLDSAAHERPSPSMSSQMRAGLGLAATSAVARASVLSGIKTTLLAISLGTLMGVHATERAADTRGAASQAYTSASLTRGPSAPGKAASDATSDSNPRSEDSLAIDNSVLKTSALVSPKAFRATRARERSSTSDSLRNASGPDLREEIRLLDLARNAVKGQKPQDALTSLDVYSTRFPAGAFRQEASVLRMQALAQRGDVGQASSMAKQFVESHPNSPYVRRASNIAKGSIASETQ